MKLRVITPTRLHWGLLRPVPRADGSRAFGGMGLTLAGPGVVLCASPAETFAFEGPFADRLESFSGRYIHGAQTLGMATVQPARLQVESAPPAHCGLGSGTQLALATAWALARLSGHPEDVRSLAGLTGRAFRSSLGCQGFAQGGLLLDPGHLISPDIPKAENPESREEFPENWPVLVFLAEEPGSWHGTREKQAFERLKSTDLVSQAMEQLARQVILPAVRSLDFQALGPAVHSFNRLAGEAFATVQGGAYSSPGIARIIHRLQSLGVDGCGQSSWGPAIFALAPDLDRANWILDRLRDECPHGAWITRAQNQGAVLEVESLG
jgi:beta-RFAP synthase